MTKQKIGKAIIGVILLCCISVVAAYFFMQQHNEAREQNIAQRKTDTQEDTGNSEKTKEESQTAEEMAGKPDTATGFIPFGEECVEGNVGVKVLKSEFTLHPAQLTDAIYQNPDNWQMGVIADTADNPDISQGFYFLTLQITNYNNESVELWENAGNGHIRQFYMYGLEKNGTWISDSGSVCFCTRNKGNMGEALHEFGNFELSAGEVAEVTYGFSLFEPEKLDEYDWYLGDGRLGLEIDAKYQKLPLMCIEEGQKVPSKME